MNAADLDELERLEKAATPGPWEIRQRGIFDAGYPTRIVSSPPGVWRVLDGSGSAHDHSLIVALRNAAPALIATARERDRLRGIVDRAMEHEQQDAEAARVALAKALDERDEAMAGVVVLAEALRSLPRTRFTGTDEIGRSRYEAIPAIRAAQEPLANLPASARALLDRVEKLEAVAKAARELKDHSESFTAKGFTGELTEDDHTFLAVLSARVAALDSPGGAK